MTAIDTQASAASRIPEPPGPDDDTSKWRRVERGPRQPRTVRHAVQLTLTPEQFAWLDARATRDRVGLDEALSRALDELRAAG